MLLRLITTLMSTLLGCSLLLLSACSEQNPTSASSGMPPAMVSMMAPKSGVLIEALDMPATLSASQHTLLRAERDAVVDQLLFQDGQFVAKDALLIQLDDQIARAELSRATADLKLADEELQRARSLFKRQVNSQFDVDKAQAEFETAQAMLSVANIELSKHAVTAPFAGYLGIRQVNLGDFVSQGDGLIEIVNLDPLYVDFSVPETLLSALSVNADIAITIPALAIDRQATVIALAPSIDTATRAMQVRAKLDNPDKQLKPGLFAKVALTVKQQDQVLWLPESAVFRNGDATQLMLSQDGLSKTVNVEVLSYQNQQVAIGEGLNATDLVVVAGHHKVPFDGMPLMAAVINGEGVSSTAAPAQDSASPSEPEP